MDFNQLAKKRYSCRNYKSKEVPFELLVELFETCRFSPSAANYQPWEFIVVTEPNLLQKIYSNYGRSWIKTAPVVVIALADKSKAWVRSDGKNHADIDLAIFIDHFTLAATAKDLATCWVCNFDVEQMILDFSIPKEKVPIAIIPIGYPAELTSSEKKRKSTKEFVYYNYYKND